MVNQATFSIVCAASLVPRLSDYCAEMWGREREPGIHCKFTRLISREFYGFVNSPYSSVNDDAGEQKCRLFFAKFWPCLFVIISFLTIGMAYLVVRRDVEPGSLLTLHKVFVGER